MEDIQYASIEEVRKPSLPKEQPSLQSQSVAAATAEEPPPLPPPNRPAASQTDSTSHLLAVKPKAASEENMSSGSCRDLESRSEQLSTSNSYPTLSAMATEEKDVYLSQGDQVDGPKLPPIYAKVHKAKKPDSCSGHRPPPVPPPTEQNGDLPPPLPPPIAPGDIPRQNGTDDAELKGLILVPQHGNGTEMKGRRPVPLPRAHVYEVVPDDIRMQQPMLEQYSSPTHFKTSLSRKASRKKRSSSAGKADKDKHKMEDKPSSPLISLSDLEPLPSNGESMKLQEFVNKFSHYLPLRVKVEEGYCGTEERFVISSGDVYNFHFVKNEKMASIHDSGGSCFSIPLNSAIRFGLLYNPSNNFKTALQGYVFKTVSELAASKYAPPRIICATRAHVTAEHKSSIQAQELLIVKKIGRTTVMRKPVLKAYSLQTNEDKTLQEDCEGHFSTNPDLVKLYLPEILEQFGGCLPLETMLYMHSDTTDDLPLHLTSDVVTLTHTAVESSIIASTCWEYDRQEELTEEDRALVAIPTDLDIEVTFLGRESDNEQLYESTRCYFEKFDSLTIRDMKSSGGMQRGTSLTLAQKKLYKAVRAGFESKGMEIKMPYRISGVFDGNMTPVSRSLGNHLEANHTPQLPHSSHAPSPGPAPSDPPLDHSPQHPPPSHHAPLPPDDDLLDDLGAIYSAIDDIIDNNVKEMTRLVGMSAAKSESTSSSKIAVERKTERTDPPSVPAPLPPKTDPPSAPQPPKPLPRNKSLTELKSQTEQLTSPAGGQGSREVNGFGDRTVAVEELYKNYSRLQLEVQELKKELQSARENEALYEVVPPPQQHAVRLRGSAPHTQRPVSIVKANNSEDQERNKEDLRNLDHMEIISLLECMNLSQYKEQFMTEQVDGEILAECDEGMLERELNITSAIHRTRLLKVITGRHSAMSFLGGAELYSTLDHR